MKSRRRVGVLTGGGDSSGINAFIRALYLAVARDGGEVVGIQNGWAGLADLNTIPLSAKTVDSVTLQPGTMLGTSRTNIVKMGLIEQALENIARAGLTHLVVLGGDDTLGVAGHLARVSNVPMIGVPQTIDNDIPGTDLTLGYATAVQRGVEAIAGIVPSNRAHGNPMLVEVMGRQAGWLSLQIALGTEADFVAIPEADWSIDELVHIHRSADRPILAVISEGVQNEELNLEHTKVDAFGNPALEGVVHQVADLFAKRAGKAPRVQVLGYIIRGGTPSVQDLNLAWSFANGVVAAMDQELTGQMVSWREGSIQYVPLEEIVGKRRTVPSELIADWRRLMWNYPS